MELENPQDNHIVSPINLYDVIVIGTGGVIELFIVDDIKYYVKQIQIIDFSDISDDNKLIFIKKYYKCGKDNVETEILWTEHFWKRNIAYKYDSKKIEK